MRSNFICDKEECQFETYHPSFTTKADGIYDRHNKKIVCEKCGEDLKYVRHFTGFATAHMPFSSKTPAEQKAILKKRSREHSKDVKEMIRHKDQQIFNPNN